MLDCALDAADGVGDGSSRRAGCTGPRAVDIPEGASGEDPLPPLIRASDSHLATVRNRLSVLKNLGVGLVITTAQAHQGGILSFLCLEAGIALVSGLDRDEANDICLTARVSMLSISGTLCIFFSHLFSRRLLLLSRVAVTLPIDNFDLYLHPLYR